LETPGVGTGWIRSVAVGYRLGVQDELIGEGAAGPPWNADLCNSLKLSGARPTVARIKEFELPAAQDVTSVLPVTVSAATLLRLSADVDPDWTEPTSASPDADVSTSVRRRISTDE
jgi:hypothetical protein